MQTQRSARYLSGRVFALLSDVRASCSLLFNLTTTRVPLEIFRRLPATGTLTPAFFFASSSPFSAFFLHFS